MLCAVFFVLLHVIGLIAADALEHQEGNMEAWERFKVKILPISPPWLHWFRFSQTFFNKTFITTADEDTRREIFFSNLQTISDHNKLFNEGKVSFLQGVNQFADMTFEEFSRSFSSAQEFGDEYVDRLLHEFVVFAENQTIPESFDWRNVGVQLEVKDQKTCRSSYAIAAIDAIEMELLVLFDVDVRLSVQEVIDCAGQFYTNGCKGGEKLGVFDYIKQVGGVFLEDDYPSVGLQGACMTQNMSESERFEFKTFFVFALKANDENLLKRVVLQTPVLTSIDINHESFMRYSSGIYYERDCITNTNHAVVVIGYGSENGLDYWIVKNSFGETWGEGGYMRIVRNRNNHCGIASDAVIPVATV